MTTASPYGSSTRVAMILCDSPSTVCVLSAGALELAAAVAMGASAEADGAVAVRWSTMPVRLNTSSPTGTSPLEDGGSTSSPAFGGVPRVTSADSATRAAPVRLSSIDEYSVRDNASQRAAAAAIATPLKIPA